MKRNISVLVLLFINFLFAYKYASRYTEFGLYLSSTIFFLQLLVYKFSGRIKIKRIFLDAGIYGFIIYILGLVVVSHFAIPLESLNVDRWSVISSFLSELFNGNYPYYAKSHMGNYPGPMPIYFLIASPFQLLGELSILSALGYGIVILWLKKKIRRDQDISFLLFYLLTSLFLIWEITTRSNVFTFSVLVLLVLNEFANFNTKSKLRFYALAIITGLALSTRSIYVLPYVVFFLSSLVNNEMSFKKLSLFVSISILAFVASFILLLYYFYSDFLVMNPFIIQSSFLVPPIYTVLFVVIAVGLAFSVKRKSDKFFYSGISLFTSILIYALYYVINFGVEASFINSKIDISYFIFCTPFLIKYLMERNSVAELK